MKRPDGAGRLDRRVTFQKRTVASDGYGGERSTWADQFTVWGGFVHLRGGETVLAERLEGVHPAVIRVRRSTDTATVTTDWRVKDANDVVYAIRDVAPVERSHIDFLVASGTAQ